MVHRVLASQVVLHPLLQDAQDLGVVRVEAGLADAEQPWLVGEQLEEQPGAARRLELDGDAERLDPRDPDHRWGAYSGPALSALPPMLFQKAVPACAALSTAIFGATLPRNASMRWGVIASASSL